MMFILDAAGMRSLRSDKLLKQYCNFLFIWRLWVWVKLLSLHIETKYECSPFLEIFSGDSIIRPSHLEAQVVRTLSTHGHRDWVQEWSVTEPSSCCWPNSWHNTPQHSEKLRLLSVIIQTLSLNDLMAPTGVTRRFASRVRTNWNKEWVFPLFRNIFRGIWS